MRSSKEKNTIEFKDMNFEIVPNIFVVTNRFTITYGMDGELKKTIMLYSVYKERIVFKFALHDYEMKIPVCVLAYQENF